MVLLKTLILEHPRRDVARVGLARTDVSPKLVASIFKGRKNTRERNALAVG
jgi:hypothetical protein